MWILKRIAAFVFALVALVLVIFALVVHGAGMADADYFRRVAATGAK